MTVRYKGIQTMILIVSLTTSEFRSKPWHFCYDIILTH